MPPKLDKDNSSEENSDDGDEERCGVCHKPITHTDAPIRHKGDDGAGRGPLYHQRCHRCAVCRRQLAGANDVAVQIRADDRSTPNELYCKRCTSKSCYRCKKPIHVQPNNKDSSVIVDNKGLTWHTFCYKCDGCEQSLQGVKSGKLVCKAPTRPGDVLLLYHQVCYRCRRCQKLLAPTVDHQLHGRCYCLHCFKKEYYPVCFECHRPITDEITDAIGREYHSDCFRCKRCSRILDGEFVSIEGRPYCDHCEKYAVPINQLPKTTRQSLQNKQMKHRQQLKRKSQQKKKGGSSSDREHHGSSRRIGSADKDDRPRRHSSGVSDNSPSVPMIERKKRIKQRQSSLPSYQSPNKRKDKR